MSVKQNVASVMDNLQNYCPMAIRQTIFLKGRKVFWLLLIFNFYFQMLDAHHNHKSNTSRINVIIFQTDYVYFMKQKV